MALAFKGGAAMLAKLQRVATQMPTEIEKALYLEAQIEMTEAKRRTPVWNPARKVPHGHTPGALRASGQVHLPKREGRSVSVALTFGGAAVDYAVYVHEDLEAMHATGQAKFLESTLKESASHMAARLAKRIDLKKVVG